MGKLTCGCLNVKIHVKSTSLEPINPSQIGIDPETTEEFFHLILSEAELNLEGIKVEHPNLLKKKKSCGWEIYECVNCEMLTHAINTVRAPSKVLVNTSVKSEAAIIERLSLSPDYSPLYKIVLRGRVDNHPIQTLGVQSGKYESLQQVLATIQQQLNQFLIEEEDAMEKRIRQYEEEQRSAYAELQSKARRDKNTLISLVLLAEQGNTSPPESPRQPQPSTPDSHNTADELRKVKSTDRNSNIQRKPAEKKVSPSSKPKQPMRPRAVSDDADGLFDFDPAFDDGSEQPFYDYESDDDGDTDESSLTDDYEGQHFSQHHMFSTSVPITVPMWGSTQKRSFEEDDIEEVEPAPDMENMAASIKALARSVHGDSREMFGELPKPRVWSKEGKV